MSRPTRYCSLNRDHNEVPVEHGNQQSMHFAWLFNWAGEPRERKYIRKAILNGKPVEGFKIDASEVLKGGVLDFEIDNHP